MRSYIYLPESLLQYPKCTFYYVPCGSVGIIVAFLRSISRSYEWGHDIFSKSIAGTVIGGRFKVETLFILHYKNTL